MGDAKQQAEEAADRAQSKWVQMKADAVARREDMKVKIDKRADQLDAKAAARTRTGLSRMQLTPSTTPSGWSTTPNWPCSTRWTRAYTQTNEPRPPACSSTEAKPEPPAGGDVWTWGHPLMTMIMMRWPQHPPHVADALRGGSAPGDYVNRLTKARAVSATSRQPLSMVRPCPRFLISMNSVTPSLSCCCL